MSYHIALFITTNLFIICHDCFTEKFCFLLFLNKLNIHQTFKIPYSKFTTHSLWMLSMNICLVSEVFRKHTNYVLKVHLNFLRCFILRQHFPSWLQSYYVAEDNFELLIFLLPPLFLEIEVLCCEQQIRVTRGTWMWRL